MNAERWDRVKRLYDEVQAHPRPDRAAFLAQACGGDAALQHEVQTLLDQPIATLDFLGILQPPQAAASLVGRRVGVYHIQALLGRGGMGEVYRARDTRLERDVAIKVLPTAYTADAERLARFEREARMVAALNHPHIAAIYGVEEGDGIRGLVLELVEGHTLAERLARASTSTWPGLPMVEALEYARQIARALEAAHAKGIIHRDLKPANIKLTDGGTLKLLDFGIAKIFSGDSPTRDLTRTAVVATDATLEGAIVGTAGYMSPQQARGEPVDTRADIWAFGCVLYEMLAGRGPFTRATSSETLAAVCENGPDWEALPRSTPARIRQVLRGCLEKDPARRPQDIASVRSAIDDVVGRRARRPLHFMAAATAAALVVAAAAIVLLREEERPPGREQWVQLTRFADSAGQPALSPDGRMVAFVRGRSTFTTQGEVYVKLLPDGDAVQLTNDGLTKMSPTFSPDGSRIAYTALEQEKWNTWQVSVVNGRPRRWLENASGLIWTAKDRLMFSEIKDASNRMAIVGSRDDRRESRDVYVPAMKFGMAHRSSVSPDGNSALIVQMDGNPWVPCRLVSLDGRSPVRKVGPPNGGCTFAAWSTDGKWMYLSSSEGGAFHIWRQRYPDGKPQQITFGPTQEEGIAMAPDGRSFVTAVASTQSAVWMHGPDGDRQISLEGFAFDPLLTPDGKRLLYRILKGAFLLDASELYMTDLESGLTRPLLTGVSIFGQPSGRYHVSSDGRRAVVITGSGEDTQLWIVPLDGRTPPRRVPNIVERQMNQPRFGPHGQIVLWMGSPRYPYAVQEDGAGLRRLRSEPIQGIRGLSPDGDWIIALTVTKDDPSGIEGPSLVAQSLRGEPDIPLISAAAPVDLKESVVKWSPDGRAFSLVSTGLDRGLNTKAYSFPLAEGQTFPPIPPSGFRSEAEIAQTPGVMSFDVYDYAPGPSEDVYAFTRESVQRNLYRIPLP